MNYLILIIAIISVVLGFLSSFFNINIIIPTTLILVDVLLDIIYKIHTKKKEDKEFYNFKSKINNNENNEKLGD